MRESSIRRDAEGRWFHEGVLVENQAIARAFDRWIDVAADGRYILKNSIDWVYVEIEGAPIFVTDLALAGDRATLSLSDGTEEPLAARSLRQDERGELYCDVRSGRLAAKLSRRAQQALEPVVYEDEEGVYLALEGQRVRPPLIRS